MQLFDRLLSIMEVPAAQLQTAALACIFMSAKLHEPCAISMRQIREYFSEICTANDVCRAELNILFKLHWDANTVTALAFIRSTLSLVVDPALRAGLLADAELAHLEAMMGV